MRVGQVCSRKDAARMNATTFAEPFGFYSLPGIRYGTPLEESISEGPSGSPLAKALERRSTKCRMLLT